MAARRERDESGRALAPAGCAQTPGTSHREKRSANPRRAAVGTVPPGEVSYSSKRYLLGQKLGKGASGTVYEAYDLVRKKRVALKRLRQDNPAAVRRFQREFATLSLMTHHNLVRLYDVGVPNEPGFFTMELVRGVDFITHVRPEMRALDIPVDEDTETVDLPPESVELVLHDGLQVRNLPPDYQRLHSCLLQLCEVVEALHTAGFIHRDLKSANIMVEPAGRVVVLDLGVVGMKNDGGDLDPTIDTYAGTPAYMSPEQLAGAPPTPAMDWYAVGMILYRALTGDRPFHGSMAAVRRAKREVELPPPAARMPGVPAYLNALCRALLSRDPAARPTGEQILAILKQAHPQ